MLKKFSLNNDFPTQIFKFIFIERMVLDIYLLIGRMRCLSCLKHLELPYFKIQSKVTQYFYS